MPATYLDEILDTHRAVAKSDDRKLDRLIDLAEASPATRDFRVALAKAAGLGVIAELKRRSPSKGDLAVAIDPADVASEYSAGGANCLSVLTDARYFGGSPSDLAAARAAVSLPTLRKDFTVSPLDVCDSRIMGADAILLIVAALDDVELKDFFGLARQLGLDILVEIHDEPELARALAIGADLIGINQRDLATFEVDTQRAVKLAPMLPAGVIRVAESGVKGPVDAGRLAEAGYHAVLVGESLVTAGSRAEAVAALRSIPRSLAGSTGSV